MNAQLAETVAGFRTAQERLHRLVERVPAELWPLRSDPDRWSVSECVEHLNLTGRAFVPVLRDGLAEARALGGPAPGRYRRVPIGWLLCETMGPPVRQRVRTSAAFVPGATGDPAELVAEFDRLQAEQISLAEAADGLPIQRVRVRSPFAERVRYNLFSCLSILPVHQHRHLWQAEGVNPRSAA